MGNGNDYDKDKGKGNNRNDDKNKFEKYNDVDDTNNQYVNNNESNDNSKMKRNEELTIRKHVVNEEFVTEVELRKAFEQSTQHGNSEEADITYVLTHLYFLFCISFFSFILIF